MKKLQQFYIMKFSSSRLHDFGYHIKRVRGGGNGNINDVRNNHELIALGDNQALRTIREIRYERNPNILKYDADKLQELYREKRQLKKQPFTKEVKKRISQINTDIDDMLFMPEYVSVVIEKDRHYKQIIKKGLYINNYKYVRLMCSAGQARVNTVILIREDFEEETKKRLKCGAKEIKITKNKYNAYFALSSSSTYLIPKPKCFLVDDCEIDMDKRVDWISKIPPTEKTTLSNNEKVTEKVKTLTFNLFDGCGAVSVEFAKRVAEALEIDYLPAAFCIRCAYVKGMVFVVDFRQYAREKGIEYLEDYYGNPQRIDDMDIILTKSQFKLCGAYDSIEEYDRLCEANHFLWGVTKVTPKFDDTYFRSNYQFVQALDLRDENNIAELCQPTIDWLKGIVGKDANYSLLYLLGRLLDHTELDFSNILNLTSDNVAKALVLNPNMIEEEYVRNTIIQSINKKIRETYLGKLILEGNFSVMIPDMYAFMQWAFKEKVTGALKEFEHFSHYWNELNVDTVVAMRSPLTWRSEVNKLNLVQNELTDKWFKYLTSGIVYNVWGCDCIIHADSDYDGDIVATTNNSVFLKCRYDNLPITYEKMTVDKEFIKEEELYIADLQSFNSIIGQITNISTSFYELLSKFEDIPGCEKEQAEILQRLKLIRKSQGDAIDKAKGIKIEPMPKHWTRWTNDLPEDDPDEDKLKFCNSIVADRKPYFFRYLYPRENARYMKYITKANEFTTLTFDKNLDEILNGDENTLTDDERVYRKRYYDYIPLIDYNGRMNKLCHYMENNLKEIKQNSNHTPSYLLDLMRSDIDRQFLDSDVLQMTEYYKRYKKTKQKMKSMSLMEKENAGNDFGQFCKNLKHEILNASDESYEYLTDLAIYICYVLYPSRSKNFVWDIFGNQIIENLKANSTEPIYLPVLDENGKIDYLGKKYSLMEVNVDGEI